MIVTKKHLPRRTILRGAGAALALPLLDSMVPALAARREAQAPVKRFGAIYVGMGQNMLIWSQPEGELKLNQILQPIEKFRDRAIVIGGLDSKEAFSQDQGEHQRAQSSWLTGCRAKKTDGPDIRVGTSLDQIIARDAAKHTQIGSLELTVEPTDLAGSCGFGFACAYVNTLAWRTPTTPLPMENNPRNVFERLFGASDSTEASVRERQLRANASVLDALTDRVKGLSRGLGPRDLQKLDEYLDGVRDAERRIQKAEEQMTKQLPVVEQPAGTPSSYEDHVKLMFDLQLLAFQTDLTRVFTFLMVRESSVRSYPEIGVADSHHPLSHHQNNTEKLGRLAKVNTYQVRLFSYFVEKLQKTMEGEHSLLDDTMLLYGSGMSDSNLHVPYNVPTLLVSGKGFGIQGNRFLQAKDQTPLTNLQLTILEQFGLPMERFGDSNGEFNRISV